MNLRCFSYQYPHTWSYNENTSVVKTNFLVETETKEGTETNMLLGLLPHQWNNLASGSAIPNEYSYMILETIRGFTNFLLKLPNEI